MAARFSVVSQNREVQVIGPTQVLDVEKVGFVTRPTGIYAEFPVPLDVWASEGAGALIGPLADAIENIISGGLASTGSYVNDLDENGLLVDYIDFVVKYVPPGGHGVPSYATVRIPLEGLLASSDPWFPPLAQSPQSMLSAAYDALVATAAL